MPTDRRPAPRPADTRRRFVGDRGSGVVTAAGSVVIVLVFVLFAFEVLFGLYARTTVGAVATDAARRAATAAADGHADMDAAEADVARRLGRYADDAVVTAAARDVDGDGRVDVVDVRVDAALPSLLPTPWRHTPAGRFVRMGTSRIDQVVAS